MNNFSQQEIKPLEHYAELATTDAQRWNDVLQLTGGALEDTKCSYHFLYYDFTISGLPILRSGTFEPTICIKFNNATSQTPLKQLSAHTSHKTLGTQKSPAGNETAAFKAILKKNTVHSKTVARSPFNKLDAWTYYHSIYLPSITYPFPSSTLSDEQCKQLQVQVKKSLLPKCGYIRNMPNAIVYGHPDYAGIHFRTLAVEKGLAQLQPLITSL